MPMPDLKALGVVSLNLETQVQFPSPASEVLERLGRAVKPNLKVVPHLHVISVARYNASGQTNLAVLVLPGPDRGNGRNLILSLGKSSNLAYRGIGRRDAFPLSPEELLKAVGEMAATEVQVSAAVDFEVLSNQVTTVIPLPIRFPTASWGQFNTITGLRLGALNPRSQTEESAIVDLIGRRIHIHLNLRRIVTIGPDMAQSLAQSARALLSQIVTPIPLRRQ